MTVAYFSSPFGPIQVTATSLGISAIAFTETPGTSDPDLPDVILECERQLRAYFAGESMTFDLPLDFGDAPQFYREVWRMLSSIPYGKIRSYSSVAMVIDRENATRAVGQAIGKNPIAIVVPCHRVLGKYGGMRGYASGIDIKRRLLHFENPSHCSPQKQLFRDMAVVPD